MAPVLTIHIIDVRPTFWKAKGKGASGSYNSKYEFFIEYI